MMNPNELLGMIRRGEDSRRQFKRIIKSEAELAEDMVAFSNGDGGIILVGVADDGTVTGLSTREVAELNKRISNAASQYVRPEPRVLTENVETTEGLVVVINIPQGLSKPYTDKDGIFWMKKGADNRKATSREELQRLFQSSGLIHADSTPVDGTSGEDIDMLYFSSFFRTQYGKTPENSGISFPQLLRNLNLLTREGELNIAGTLLFGVLPHLRLPAFIVKAAAFRGINISTDRYLDSRNLEGKIAEQFNAALAFLINNTGTRQNGRSVNSIGEPEVPHIVWEELVTNALIHRDYFTSASVRILVFSDRVEIVSPGHLPNNLTVENIKAGNSNIRNPILASYAAKILPYRGLGSGIIRAVDAYPDIDFIDDRDGNLFKVIVKRNNAG